MWKEKRRRMVRTRLSISEFQDSQGKQYINIAVREKRLSHRCLAGGWEPKFPCSIYLALRAG